MGSSNDPSKNALHRSVAIKVVGVPTEGDVTTYKKKILKEVKLHKILTHLNILRLLDWSEGKGGSSIWIVLEYAQGGDLFDKISTLSLQIVLLSVLMYSVTYSSRCRHFGGTGTLILYAARCRGGKCRPRPFAARADTVLRTCRNTVMPRA